MPTHPPPSLVSLPEAVAFCFYDASTEWKLEAIQILQEPFWGDPTVANSTGRVTVFVKNLNKRLSLRAVDFKAAVGLVERLSDDNGLNARYEDVMDAIVAPAEDAPEGEVDIVAPEDAV